MQKLKIPQGDWIIVCDGKKALVLENIGDDKFLNLRTREVYEHPDPKTHELGTDAPGRALNSLGTPRSAMEQTDWHTQEEEKFLRKVADRLDAAVNAGQVKVADPHRAATGAWRAAANLFSYFARCGASGTRQGFRQASLA